jgi:hypothetical protein
MPDDVMLELIDGVQPEGPLADVVESFLDRDGVPVDERDVDAIAQRLQARIAGPQPQRSRWWLAALPLVAAAAAVAGVMLWQAERQTAGMQAPELAAVVAPVPVVSSEALRIGEGAIAGRVEDTLHLVAGAIRYERGDGMDPGVHAVRLRELDIVLQPVGTIFVASAGRDMAVVGVDEGVVQILDDRGDEVGRLSAGRWAALGRGATGDLVMVSFGEGHQPLPAALASVGAADEVERLLVSARWLTLSSQTREALDDIVLPDGQ